MYPKPYVEGSPRYKLARMTSCSLQSFSMVSTGDSVCGRKERTFLGNGSQKSEVGGLPKRGTRPLRVLFS